MSQPLGAFALTFRNTSFDIIDRDGRVWLKAGQIAEALGYSDDKAIHRIYARNSDEFTDAMTGVVKLTTPSGDQETRVFSIRGANLIGMKAKTEIAKEFRVWTLDVLEGKSNLQNSGTNATLPDALISTAQAGELAQRIAEKFPEGKHRPYAWSRFNNHFRLSGYKTLPASRYEEALEYIAGMVPKEVPALPAPNQTQIEQAALTELTRPDTRFIVQFVKFPGQDYITPVLAMIHGNARMVDDESLASLIAEPGQINRALLPGIIQAAVGRLS